MNWIQSLYVTYENCQAMVGVATDENQVPLLPICHTTQKAQIEITLDAKGNFRRARVVGRDEARTIIPCTEKSAGRTSGKAPHPLCDKLQYLAADYRAYGGNKEPYFESYAQLLSDWASNDAPEKARLIYEYIQQGRVVADLVTYGILFTDENGILCVQRPFEKKKNAAIDIFDLLPGRINPKTGQLESWQADAFVRWKVETGDAVSEVWNDTTIIQSWIGYYSSTKQVKALCYVTGKESFQADQHPAKIRNDADKAKLIASGKSVSDTGKITIDDGCGFTFLGRFTYPDQAATVGFEATQKAHFALRWLMSRQGFMVKGELAVVAWATSGAKILQPTDDPITALDDDLPSEEEKRADTAQDVGLRFKKKVAGYRQEIGDRTDVIVIAVDSATTGRLSIVYYRMLNGSDFLERIERWHESCAWLHTYRSVAEKDEKGITRKRYIPFIGAPTPDAIAEAAYGARMDDKLKKATIRRLLPCIVDGQPIPRDLVESVIRRASNRIGIKDPDDKKYRGVEEYTWEKALSIGCALYRKYKEGKERYDMSLDETRTSRDYLYGRLLALADSLEEWALNEAGEKRETNAARLMQRFAERPYSTWRTIELALAPYKARLGGKSKKRQQMIDEVIASFDADDFLNDKRLSGEFLLGFHCQREFLRSLRRQAGNSDSDTSETDTSTYKEKM